MLVQRGHCTFFTYYNSLCTYFLVEFEQYPNIMDQEAHVADWL